LRSFGVSFSDESRFVKDLLSLVHQKKVGMFHVSWPAGHNNTNYKRFYAAAPGDVYLVTQYQTAYEPYVIFKRDAPPW
jgi:general stress protein 26